MLGGCADIDLTQKISTNQNEDMWIRDCIEFTQYMTIYSHFIYLTSITEPTIYAK